jgi:hypothetical protein
LLRGARIGFMKRDIFALALALSVIPVAALAQGSNAPPALSPDQRQALHQTFERFAQQEEQLHQQMRWQILSVLSPVHRRVVGATIGELAIMPNPDVGAAAKRLDEMLSPGEQQRILAAHASFEAQSRQLHEQMRTELQSELPAAHQNFVYRGSQNGPMQERRQLDAGTLLLVTLTPHSEMMGVDWHGPVMLPAEGAPPQ